jgi:hypothetical protein
MINTAPAMRFDSTCLFTFLISDWQDLQTNFISGLYLVFQEDPVQEKIEKIFHPTTCPEIPEILYQCGHLSIYCTTFHPQSRLHLAHLEWRKVQFDNFLVRLL